jgi:hypothetical protein
MCLMPANTPTAPLHLQVLPAAPGSATIQLPSPQQEAQLTAEERRLAKSARRAAGRAGRHQHLKRQLDLNWARQRQQPALPFTPSAASYANGASQTITPCRVRPGGRRHRQRRQALPAAPPQPPDGGAAACDVEEPGAAQCADSAPRGQVGARCCSRVVCGPGGRLYASDSACMLPT